MARGTLPPEDDFVTLARLALSGRPEDVQAYIHRTARRRRADAPELSKALTALLREAPTRSSPLRREAAVPLPLDGESRLQLLRIEPPSELDTPIFNSAIASSLNQVVAERNKAEDLYAAGLDPTRSLLFIGPPGVGKTLSARWLSGVLQKPLLILDLSAVMSSLLGKTGNNVRAVLDYARSVDCILFLDELDAIAKRRDDASEIGELKRLVTVLLQAIDEWPSQRLLIGATNHPGLLDPAVWRRFDSIIQFDPPDEARLREAIRRFSHNDPSLTSQWETILTLVFANQNFSEVERSIHNARRRAVIAGTSLADELRDSAMALIAGLPREGRLAIARELHALPNISQRQASEITGISRDTLRKFNKPSAKKKTEEAHG